MTEARIRLREEVSEQIKALNEVKIMGDYYGLDLSRPARNARAAVQWVYMALRRDEAARENEHR